MDLNKKRKLDENGAVLDSDASAVSSSSFNLDREDARKIIERFSPDQLIDLVLDALARHSDVLDAVRSIADPDTSQRKLFIRGLGWDTTTDGLRSLFSAYGELDEAIVILDKNTGKSKGYGFVTFKHVDAAYRALKEPSKKIDGRMTITQLASAGNNNNNSGGPVGHMAASVNNSADVLMRKIYVGNVPYEMVPDKLLAHFAQYGEVEEGPLGFDKQTGKCKGYALFVYKSLEGAQKALVDPVKMIEGRQLNCKFASEGKKGKMGGSGGKAVDGGGSQGGVGEPNVHGNGMGMGMGPPSSMPGQYGAPGGGFGYRGQPQFGQYPGISAMGNAGPGTGGGYGSASGGGYNLGGGGATGYGLGGGGGGLSGIGGGASGGGSGGGSSLYGLPASSGGLASGRYPDGGGAYGLLGFQNPHHQQGTSPLPRPGGMYPNGPYY